MFTMGTIQGANAVINNRTFWLGDLQRQNINISTIKSIPATSVRSNNPTNSKLPNYTYHYTNSANIPDINAGGLNASSDGFVYTTPEANYTPEQVPGALNVDPAGGVRDAVYQIDIKGLYHAHGIFPSGPPTPVVGGSGFEIKFPVQNIPKGPYLVLFRF